MEIRPLTPHDRAAWLPLWTGYLDFYNTEVAPEITAMSWQRFYDPAVPTYVLGAFVDEKSSNDKLIGIAHYLLHYSCRTVGPYCYLQDLFVTPELRGKGIGRALIEGVYTSAANYGADRVYWLTQDTNVDAMKLYDQVATKTGFLQYRKMLG
jgi:GNAT superfamily N-acetyltransferase